MAAHAQAAPARMTEKRREAMWGYGFTSVWVIGFLVFTAVPIAIAVWISFTSWSPVAGPFWTAHTIGLQNYQTFLTDHRYWHSVVNTLY